MEPRLGDSSCTALIESGFARQEAAPSGTLTPHPVASVVAVPHRTFAPGVSSWITYEPVVVNTEGVSTSHGEGEQICWHQMRAGTDFNAARCRAFELAIAALDDDIDAWEVRGQFAFADPNMRTHRWHAQKSRLRLSKLRYEIGVVSQKAEEFPSLGVSVAALRQRISDAYELLAEMTASSLADKSDLEEAQRGRLNLLLSIIAALILSPGLVISFVACTESVRKPSVVSLLLACLISSMVTGDLILALAGVRVALRNTAQRFGFASLVALGVLACVVRGLFVSGAARIECELIALLLLATGIVLVMPLGRKQEFETAPPQWTATWNAIRNDNEHSWRMLDGQIEARDSNGSVESSS